MSDPLSELAAEMAKGQPQVTVTGGGAELGHSASATPLTPTPKPEKNFPKGFDPRIHVTDANGNPIRNKDPKRHGEFKKKVGRKSISDPVKKTAQNKSSTPPPNEPKFVDPHAPAPPDPSKILAAEIETRAKEYAAIEETVCVAVLQSKAFDESTRSACVRSFEAYFREKGIKPSPWWAEVLAGQIAVVSYVHAQEKPRTIIEKAKQALENQLVKFHMWKKRRKNPDSEKDTDQNQKEEKKGFLSWGKS